MFEKYLQEIGLSDKEASVYLTLLSVESASVLDLSKKAGIKRPTTYTTLESLAKKGLVSEVTIGKKTHYHAELPEKLETFINRKMINLEESKKVLKDIIPQLKSISRESGEKAIVKYFEGKEGIISATDEFLKVTPDSAEPMYFLYSKDLLEDVFSKEELNSMRKSRLDRNIKSKTLYTYEKGDLASDETAERVKIDSKKYPLTCDITVYKDIVRIGILGKRLSGIFIKNQDVAETFRSLFKFAFDNRKK